MLAVFTKSLNTLRPASSEAEELLKKIKLGAVVVVEIKQPRNLKWHRLYWKTMQLIADNLEGNYSPESISDFIKIQTGLVDVVQIGDQIIQTPKSISFANMKHAEWEAYYAGVVSYICSEIIPGLDSEDVKNEVLSMVS